MCIREIKYNVYCCIALHDVKIRWPWKNDIKRDPTREKPSLGPDTERIDFLFLFHLFHCILFKDRLNT